MSAQQAPDTSGLVIVVYVEASALGGTVAQGAVTVLALEHGVVLAYGELHPLAAPRRFSFLVRD